MIENNTQITKEILGNNILIFQPKTPDEAAFIQQKIFELGGVWGETKRRERVKVQSLGDCVATGMVVKNGQLYYNPSNESKSHGVLCTSEQLDKSYVPPLSTQERSAFAEAFAQVSEELAQVSDRLAVVERQLAARTPLKVSAAKSPAA